MLRLTAYHGIAWRHSSRARTHSRRDSSDSGSVLGNPIARSGQPALPEARKPERDRLLQGARRIKQDPHADRRRARARCDHRLRGKSRAGGGVSRIAAGHPGADLHAGIHAAGEGDRDARLGRGSDSLRSQLRRGSGGSPAPLPRRESGVSPRLRRSRGDRGAGHHRAGAAGADSRIWMRWWSRWAAGD